jgi:nucleoside-diphosphate-sugar epimerase
MTQSSFKRVLITGGAGFLGSNLAEYFIVNKIPVVAVDNFATSSQKNVNFLKKRDVHGFFQFIEADVIKDWTWTQNLEKNIKNNINSEISHVFHFASPASPPLYKKLSRETMLVNSVGLLNAIDFADSQKARVIFASTSEVYGDPNISPQPESYWGHVNSFGERACYDESKRFGEALIYSHNKKHNTLHGLVRIFNTYGPRMDLNDGRVVINFLVQALKNKSLEVYGTGNQTRSFCYVDDLLEGVTRYALSDLTTPVNLGNDGEFSLLQLIDVIAEIFEDQKISTIFKSIEPDDPMQRRPDLALAKKYLYPWAPKINLKEGLLKTLNWLKTLEME